MRLCPLPYYSSEEKLSIPGVTQGNLGLTLSLNSLDFHQTQNQKTKSWTNPAFSFHFPETGQVFSNLTPITQSSINTQQNKNQPPLAYHLQVLNTH